MQKRVLITVSDDFSSLHGVRFVGSFFRNKSVVHPTLFYVAPHAGGPEKHLGPEPHRTGRNGVEASRKKAREALDTARQMLCDRGFPPENMMTKFIFREFGTVKDIIREAREGAYDAVVLGRRGYTFFQPLLSTSVTRAMLDHDIDFPVWICRHPEENRRNVLLCVNGSAASLRMVDHVGSMLRGESEHSITLFHLDTGEGEDAEAILKEAKERLIDPWGSEGRLESVVTASPVTGVAKTILDTAETGGYAAVGIGRVGLDKGRLKEWLVGSRTMRLVESLEKAALWVSR